MTTKEKAVKDISSEIYTFGVQQILIDFVQEDVEGLLNPDEPITGDDIGALSYQCNLLLEVYNPKFEKDFSILTRLSKAIDDWQSDFEYTNNLLGLPPSN